jgi:hypothetical protein
MGNRALGVFLQTKLQVGPTGDHYEQEADRIAEHVMRMPVPGPTTTSRGGEALQRKCRECEEEESHGPLSRKVTGSAVPTKTLAPPIVHEVLRSPGRPLDNATRAFFEPRFGRNFGHVRVHTDDRAAASAASVRALAYTVGNNLVFGAGQYAPDSPKGRQLLAHELTHVQQQQRPGAEMIQRYDESTEPNTKLGQVAAGASLLTTPGLIYAAYCLSKLERPMIDITFNRWIADACGRAPAHIMHSREWDAFGHCWIGCEGSRRCGEVATHLSGTVREYYREGQRILRIRPHDSFKQDLANQKLGRTLAYTAGTCYKLCDNAHTTGTLGLSAPVAECVDCSLTKVACPP